MEPTDLVQIHVEANSDSDEAELDELTRGLRAELLHTDVERVDLAIGASTPPSAKGVGAAALGSLVVEVARSTDLLRSLIAAIGSWVSRHSVRTVKMQLGNNILEITGASTAEQHALIDVWIARLAADSPPQV